MVEEACGTRLYEMKKMQAQKTMEKKESKVNEINKLLREGVSVCWLLSRRHHADAGEVAKSAERVPAVGVELDRDRLHRQETAYLYYQARETLREGDEENRLLAEELQLKDALKRVEVCV